MGAYREGMEEEGFAGADDVGRVDCGGGEEAGEPGEGSLGLVMDGVGACYWDLNWD